jgi:hypothetical protein
MDPVEVYRGASGVVASEAPGVDEVLGALRGLPGVRRDLDRVERELIGAARERGAGWPEIAAALGLGSRQAAVQRWVRLSGDGSRDPGALRQRRTEQRIVDEQHGIGGLRRAVEEAYRRIAADHGWDDRHRRAALVRTTLAAAVQAPPSAMYALCHNAIEDLEAMRMVPLPPALAEATRGLARALRRAP